MGTSEHEVLTSQSDATESRRTMLRASLGGFALAASGLFLPTGDDEAAAREGALGGAKGGRYGKDHKGRHRRRSHGDKKEKGKGHDEAPPQSHGLFRATALTVVNLPVYLSPPVTLRCTFYYRIKTDLDAYGPPIASVERTLAPGESFRYAPDRYRVGVLVKHFINADDFYADVRNVSFWFPRGGVTSGPNLDPPSGKVGNPFIAEQNFYEGESHALPAQMALQRNRDSDTHIEWELTVVQL
jgi:hypothetical protein